MVQLITFINNFERITTMKKLLLILMALTTFVNADILLMDYQNQFESGGVYSITPIAGTSTSKSPVVYDDVGTFVMNGSVTTAPVGVSPESSSAWDSVSEGTGNTLALPVGQIYVGNVSNLATNVNMSGAITINSLGVTTPTISTFWITSTGASNNVLTGVQDRYGTVATATILPSTMISVNVVYPSACRTNVLSLTISVLESTSGLDLTSKIISSSLSGFTAEIYNNDVAIPSQVGSLNYQTVCN